MAEEHKPIWCKSPFAKADLTGKSVDFPEHGEARFIVIEERGLIAVWIQTLDMRDGALLTAWHPLDQKGVDRIRRHELPREADFYLE